MGLGSIRVRSDEESSLSSFNPRRGTLKCREPRSSVLSTRIHGSFWARATLGHAPNGAKEASRPRAWQGIFERNEAAKKKIKRASGPKERYLLSLFSLSNFPTFPTSGIFIIFYLCLTLPTPYQLHS